MGNFTIEALARIEILNKFESNFKVDWVSIYMSSSSSQAQAVPCFKLS